MESEDIRFLLSTPIPSNSLKSSNGTPALNTEAFDFALAFYTSLCTVKISFMSFGGNDYFKIQLLYITDQFYNKDNTESYLQNLNCQTHSDIQVFSFHIKACQFNNKHSKINNSILTNTDIGNVHIS